MSTRIIRLSDEQRYEIDGLDDEALNLYELIPLAEVVSAFDAAPDEATLPTIPWCAMHTRPSWFCGTEASSCRFIRVPLPVHLGVEVTP